MEDQLFAADPEASPERVNGAQVLPSERQTGRRARLYRLRQPGLRPGWTLRARRVRRLRLDCAPESRRQDKSETPRPRIR